MATTAPALAPTVAVAPAVVPDTVVPADADVAMKKSNKLPTPLDPSQFEMGVTLGTGSFGRVRFATHKKTGTYWAIKILKKAEIIRLQQVCTMNISSIPIVYYNNNKN
jgi:hypothetical protein